MLGHVLIDPSEPVVCEALLSSHSGVQLHCPVTGAVRKSCSSRLLSDHGLPVVSARLAEPECLRADPGTT